MCLFVNKYLGRVCVCASINVTLAHAFPGMCVCMGQRSQPDNRRLKEPFGPMWTLSAVQRGADVKGCEHILEFFLQKCKDGAFQGRVGFNPWHEKDTATLNIKLGKILVFYT